MKSGLDRARRAWLQVAVYFLAGAILLLCTNFMRSPSYTPEPVVESETPAVVVP